MKKYFVLLIMSILAVLALTFTQVFAAGPQLAMLKKTPPVIETVKAKKPPASEKKETKVAEKETRQAFKVTAKAEKSPKPDKSPRVSKTPKPRIGKPVNFRGTIANISASSLELALKKGGSQTVEMDGETRIHIPTMGYEASEGSLQIGMEVSVHAVVVEEGKDPLAKSVHVIPGKPSYTHHPGTVQSYAPGASITLTTVDGSAATFDISQAKILPDADTVIHEGTAVTLVFSRKDDAEPGTVIAIVVHPTPD